MPLTFTITKDTLPSGTEKDTFKKLSEAMLRHHGLLGNRALTPNLVGSINVLPREAMFAGLDEAEAAFIEWKVPSFAFADREVQKAYVAEATQIVHEASLGRLPKERIWVNVVHAVDGAWGIAGQALTNEELGGLIAQG